MDSCDSSRLVLTRRALLTSLPALALTAKAAAQTGKTSIPVRKLNHMTLFVSDVKRSREFYQGLFGLPVQARQGAGVVLGVGAGPENIALAAAGPGTKTGINHLCMAVDGFDADRILKTLAEHGVSKTDAATSAPLKAWVRMRGEEAGGAKAGTPELYFNDPDGIRVQIQDASYCSGGGVLGNECGRPEPAPSPGLLPARELSHFTLRVSDARRSTAFYQQLFGMRIQAYQGAIPVLAIGQGREFLFVSPGGANAMPGVFNIDHACLTIDGFQPDKVLKALGTMGVKPRGNAAAPAPPLVSWVRMRGEDAGGAKGGTPELYFTDPDGITMQIQDTSYCGGAGYLGEVCG